MLITLTSIARIKDWKALRRLNAEILIEKARELGAVRYRIYRNMNDASQVLFIVDLADREAVREMGEVICEQLSTLLQRDVPDDQAWEPVDWDSIG
ncbi:MAG: hypothetical protein NVSMB27_19790 [Ktedonobacteraceae bacterium]